MLKTYRGPPVPFRVDGHDGGGPGDVLLVENERGVNVVLGSIPKNNISSMLFSGVSLIKSNY